jgi:D-glycero-alpha-D-manno-heptose 1-phosphate guanylyltransferase
MPEAVILAGGFGTRLQSVISEIPKSMAPVNGRPFLEYQLDFLISFGYDKIVMSVGFLHHVILEHFGNQYKNIHLDYAVEEHPLGTGGGIRLALQKCSGNQVLALNGDTLFMPDLDHFNTQHLAAKADISMALRRVEDVSRYGAVQTDHQHRLLSYGEKSSQKNPGFINGGIYLIRREFFLTQTPETTFSIEKDIFEKTAGSHCIYGFPYTNYFLDIGIPDDYKRAQDEFERLRFG